MAFTLAFEIQTKTKIHIKAQVPSHISVDFNIQKNTGKEDNNYKGPSPSLFISFNYYGNQSNPPDCHKTCPLIDPLKSGEVTSFLQKYPRILGMGVRVTVEY